VNSASPVAEPEALIERRGCAGFITLNRPKALNALTLGMVRIMAAALDAWERDPSVTRAVILGAGERAFCAGGDIRRLYEHGLAGDHDAQLTFWREEYQLNRRIKTYSKPYVALIDGIVMGGGVGVSAYASHRVAGERYRFAMPEVGIGFFPDVGATWLLPRLPRNAGVYFALTGANAAAGDALALGLADVFVASAATGALAKALEQPAPIDDILAGFASPPPTSALTSELGWIETAFGSFDRETILGGLEVAERGGSAGAAKARAAMLATSPASQAIALRQMTIGRGLDFDEAMRMEFRVVSRICRGHDFYEGVRATIVDKDGRPRWRPLPASAAEAALEIDGYFASLGADEIVFPGTAP
jgi:enoyl-CoA hydratase